MQRRYIVVAMAIILVSKIALLGCTCVAEHWMLNYGGMFSAALITDEAYPSVVTCTGRRIRI